MRETALTNNGTAQVRNYCGLCLLRPSPREEPPQNPNKNAEKMFFFHGNFYMVRTGMVKSMS